MIVSSRICRDIMTTCAGGSQPTRGISRPPSALTGARMSTVVCHLLLPSCCPFPSIKGAWNQPWMKMGLQDTLILPSSNWPACWKNSFSTQHSLGIGWGGREPNVHAYSFIASSRNPTSYTQWRLWNTLGKSASWCWLAGKNSGPCRNSPQTHLCLLYDRKALIYWGLQPGALVKTPTAERGGGKEALVLEGEEEILAGPGVTSGGWT